MANIKRNKKNATNRFHVSSKCLGSRTFTALQEIKKMQDTSLLHFKGSFLFPTIMFLKHSQQVNKDFFCAYTVLTYGEYRKRHITSTCK